VKTKHCTHVWGCTDESKSLASCRLLYNDDAIRVAEIAADVAEAGRVDDELFALRWAFPLRAASNIPFISCSAVKS